MRNFLIDLNRYYQNHKAVIWTFTIIAILIMLVSNQIVRITKNARNSSNNTTVSGGYINSNSSNANRVISEIINNNETKNENVIKNNNKKIENAISSKQEAIETFITLCNNGEIDYAYNLLTDDCKELLYPTKKDFTKKYYNVIFKTHKIANIVSFKNDTYKVDFSEDDIVNGKKDENVVTDYITVVNKKLNLSSLIGKTNISNRASNEYIYIELTNRIVYMNYEVYTANIKNLTNADIYLNDIENTNLYLTDSNEHTFEINNGDYLSEDYKIGYNSSKSIQLKFMRYYNTDSKITSISFKNINIRNRLYYDNTSVDPSNVTESVIYEQKMTKYPNKTELIVKL